MNNPLTLLFTLTLALLLSSCIKDDFIDDSVDPVLEIINPLDSLGINSSHQFISSYLNNVGIEEEVTVEWSSSNSDVIAISKLDGIANGLTTGSSVISVEYDDGSSVLKDEVEVHVGMNTVLTFIEKKGTVNTTSSYALSGDFILKKDGTGLILEFGDDYNASSALPGLYVYLSNNNTTTVNALEIGAVQVFSGAHTYSIPNTGINDYKYVLYFCKPFNVKVGDGEIQ